MGSGPLILLDTHALIWLSFNDPALGPEATRLADSALRAGQLAVRAMTFWEIAMLIRRRRLELDDPFEVWRNDFLGRGLIEVPITGETAVASVGLQGFHADQADRMIVATAQHYRATLVTADRKILSWRGILDRWNASR